MKKAVVVMSGGLDSTVLLHFVRDRGYEIYGLSFDYGQRHRKELDMAKYWGEKLCNKWELVNLSFMKTLIQGSALLNDALALPEEHYTHKNQKITVVPNRNMIMLSIAIAWAEDITAEKVFFGAHANDHAIYPDCRPSFLQSIDKTARLATYNGIQVDAPFINMTKKEVVALGRTLGVDFEKTWSCYAGKDIPCGVCATCQERKEALL